MDVTPSNGGYDGLSLEETNAARLQALNAMRVGINGINEALMLRMLERLLGPSQTDQVKQEHQEWLSEQLDGADRQLAEIREKEAEEMRRATILGRGRN